MKKVILITMLITALLFAFVGCAKTNTTEDTTTEDTTTEDTTVEEPTEAPTEAPTEDTTEDTAEPVSLTFAGSTSVGPAIEALADMYMEVNPNVDITVEAGGSSVA